MWNYKAVIVSVLLCCSMFCLTGFLVYLVGVPDSWRSKPHRFALSGSQAEDVAISEAFEGDSIFVYYLLQDIGVYVLLPFVVKTDNIGALFM
jgi:hypothetical protein